ncbi:acyltransferase family protein [Actinocrispum wychmicini]|uniref:Peptidoglycan/LPS O-acetylase OafA/YrhL n=1 Tax=Actinocrispum wychmicini TaxID=1213861 RepID=A0A4R2JZ04_9PSEU|nr:acyltransferase [Actinocrispum wychmicini]TCO64577.1 peptidoglycan/LPS O-acetylase OafA/YrhL [Actinocrispum wychmicini]
MSEATRVGSRTGYLHGLDVVRVLASCLVLYTHIHEWFVIKDRNWWLTDWVQRNVVDTFQFNDRFSFLGIATFLVVSGVVVTYVTERENPGQFLWRRVTRIAPLLWVVTLIAWILINLGQQVAQEPMPDRLGIDDLARGLVLANYFVTPLHAMIGVTWTLVVQIGFYCYVAASIPLLRRKPWLPPLIAAGVCFTVVLAATGSRNPVVQELLKICAYMPVLCLGQLISLVHTGRVRIPGALAVGAVQLALFFWMDRAAEVTNAGYANVRTVVIVLLLTAVMIKAKGRVARSTVIRNWSRRTYAIYLIHLSCVFVIMDHVSPLIGPDAAVLLVLVTVAGTAEILHRYVEMPAERWLRARRSPVRQ